MAPLTREQLIKMGATPAQGAAPSGAPAPGAKLTREQLLAMGAVPSEVSRETQQQPPEKKDGLLKTIIKSPIESLVVKPAVRAAEALAGVGAFGKTVQRGAEMNAAKGTDVDLPLLGNIHVEPVKTGLSGVKQAAGEGLEAASYLVGGGGAKTVGQGVAKTTFGSIVKRGAIEGAKAGGLYGAGEALQEDEGVGGTLLGAAKGAAVGGAAGGTLAAGLYGVSKAIGGVEKVAGKVREGFAERAARKAAENADNITYLQGNVPEASIAGKTLAKGAPGAAPKVVPDRAAKELIRQGVPEADVALIKTAPSASKAKMVKMLDIRQSQLTNKRVTARATDVVGDSFLQQAKHIEKVNKEAGKQLGELAKKLSGKRADPTAAIAGFADDLDNAGVKVGRGNKLNFKGSDFEGNASVQRTIQNAWDRAMRVARSGDALQMHRAKTYIDEVVEYGKAVEGLTGRSQRILKNFRRGIDTALDVRFPAYNKANTTFSETVRELDKIGQAMGRNFRLGDSFADAKAGVVMRRILSNTQSRSDILQLLESMQEVARKNGMDIQNDIISEAQFADILERMLGSEAPTSFLGQIERGAAGIAGDVVTGNLGGAVKKGTLTAGKHAIDVLSGVNQKNLISAMRALIGRLAEKGPTAFGL